MDFEKIDIHELLPQQEPFVTVGRLLHFDMGRTTTATRVEDSNIFVEDGVMTPSGVVENIAQTCAARIGYINKYILGKNIRIGFIGAIRNLRLHRLPRTGEELETTVVTVEEVFGMTLVHAMVKSGAETIAESEMKIALDDTESKSTNQ